MLKAKDSKAIKDNKSEEPKAEPKKPLAAPAILKGRPSTKRVDH